MTELKPPDNVLLAGIVGSTAYGLAAPDSDIDRIGMFAAPTESIVGLSPPSASVVSSKPDATFHEAGKMASLLLKCNPTVTELLWLPSDLYEKRTPLGDALITIKRDVLSRKYVRDAYLGYATQQFRRLENRGDGSFSADTRKRTAKHARHLARLLTQGQELYVKGRLRVRLDNPEWFLDFGEKVAGGDLDIARRMLASAETAFGTSRSAIRREHPDPLAAEEWLQEVRRAFYRKPAWQPFRPYTAKPGTPPAVLCDIDGTLAIRGDRSPYDYTRVGEDKLNEPVARFLHSAADGRFGGTPHRIILLSGREDTSRLDTEEWLTRHSIPFDELHMRPEDDFRSDALVKHELFGVHVEGRFDVRLVLDDRNRVVDLWRQLGLPCWQVNDGDF